jgi:hypothetical protein
MMHHDIQSRSCTLGTRHDRDEDDSSKRRALFRHAEAICEPSYHDYYVTIEGHGLTLNARKYDDESEMSIQSGITEADSDAIETVRNIARQIFRTSNSCC